MGIVKQSPHRHYTNQQRLPALISHLSQSSVVAAEGGAISAASAAAMGELWTVMGMSTNMSRHDRPLARIFSIDKDPAVG
jgi:hypothetical protein